MAIIVTLLELGDQNEAPTPGIVFGDSVPRQGQKAGPCLPVCLSLYLPTQRTAKEKALSANQREPSPHSSPALTLSLDIYLPGLRHSRQNWPQHPTQGCCKQSRAMHLALTSSEPPAGMGYNPTKGKLPRWPHALPLGPSHLRLSPKWAVELVYCDESDTSRAFYFFASFSLCLAKNYLSKMSTI